MIKNEIFGYTKGRNFNGDGGGGSHAGGSKVLNMDKYAVEIPAEVLERNQKFIEDLSEQSQKHLDAFKKRMQGQGESEIETS